MSASLTGSALKELKAQIRAQVRAERARLKPANEQAASASVVEQLSGLLREGAVVGVYAAFSGELSLDPLCAARPDLKFAWPRVRPGTSLMDFVLGQTPPKARGAYAIREPASGEVVSPLTFDAILVPGVAFDARGARLGMGKGFYDRYLAMLRPDALRVGICYTWQLHTTLPEEPHDLRMTHVAHDAALITCPTR